MRFEDLLRANSNQCRSALGLNCIMTGTALLQGGLPVVAEFEVHNYDYITN